MERRPVEGQDRANPKRSLAADAAALSVLTLKGARRALNSATVRRSAIAGVLGAAAIGTTVIIVAVLLARESPTWWRSVDPDDPRIIELAERVEQAVVSAMHRRRPYDEPWTVAVSAQQANAWLNVKLPRWIASRDAQWPRQLGQVQTHFANDRVSVGVRIGSDGEDQIVAATVNPVLREDGTLWLTQPSTNAGRLDLPAGWTIARLSSWLPSEIRHRQATSDMLDALKQAGPALPRTWIDLDDGRRVRLLSVRIDDDRLLLTCVTERPNRSIATNATNAESSVQP